MSDYENAIEIKKLTKRYDGFTLDNISFNVPKGSIMGFIGQNGAGKSTTINTILNIIKADSGEIRVFGKDTRTADVQIKQNISAVFDELPFHEQLNAKAGMAFCNCSCLLFLDYLLLYSLHFPAC